MSCDIHGEVQQRYEPGCDWERIISIGDVLEQCYTMFGCLFGVRNYANFPPLFGDRGFPADCPVPEDFDSWCCHSPTWCSAQEVLELDLEKDLFGGWCDRIFHYQVLPDGTERYDGESEYSTDYAGHIDQIRAGTDVRIGDTIYRRGRHNRRDVLAAPDFRALYQILRKNEWRGTENVRLIVWFDN